MTENHTNNSDSDSSNSSKRLVKILVIVGIGVPVLVELMTLFNLINVQIFEDEEIQEQPEPVAEVRMTEGDTLFRDYGVPVTIDLLRINVSAQQWRFELGLSIPESVDREPLEVEVDSMRLNSGKILAAGENHPWNIQEEHTPSRMHGEWELPNGDIPGTLYISSFQQAQNDTARRVQQEVPLGNIPVRYNRE